MEGIVNKPQFNTQHFPIGKAVHISPNPNSNDYTIRKMGARDGIIIEASPLYLKVSYYDTHESDMEVMTISIDDVVSSNYEVNVLVYRRAGNECGTL